MAELISIMAEMKLIMPREILEKAYFVEIATLLKFTPLTSNWDQAASTAVSDFVSAVRSHFGLKD